MRIREARKKETIQRILDAAAWTFAQTGYDGARVDAIAERANINKAMIYYHIGDKKALYTRVLHEVFGNTAARMAAHINRAETPRQKVQAYIHSIGQTLEKHPHLPRIMMWEMASGGRNLPDIVVTDLASIMGLISGLIAQGCRQGEFENVDPLVLHLMAMGGIAYYRASTPIRAKFSDQMKKEVSLKEAQDTSHLLEKIQVILLNALTRK